jgi:hypothetical protein
MTSVSKISANRANARASTGPKTVRGRRNSARNALRHALSVPIHSDSILFHEIKTLAEVIAGADGDAEIRELAYQIAEAQIDIQRVRAARHKLLSEALSDPYYESRADMRMKVRLICSVLRPRPPEMSLETLTKIVTTTPQGPQKFATILSKAVNEFLILDRYERRALSRRKFAIRAFDELQRKRLRESSPQGLGDDIAPV